MNPQQVEHANATKARWVTLVHFSSLLLFGNQEPIFKWRDGLEDWQTEQEWLESSSLDRQGAADGAGDEELHREVQLQEIAGRKERDFCPPSEDKIRAKNCTVGLSEGKGASESCKNQLG